jgi:hypothetical protein
LTYVTCQLNWDGSTSSIEKSAVKIFSISANVSKTILEKDKGLLFIESWGTNNIIKINIQDENDNFSQQFFDLNSEKWITPTSTP